MIRVLKDFRYIAWIFAFLFFIAATLPVGDISGAHGFDKILHFVGFFYLMVFFLRGYTENSWFKMLMITILIGLSVEIVQAFIPYRSFSFYDFLADSSGAILGYLSYRFFGDLSIDAIGTFLFIGKIPFGPGTLASLTFILAIYYLQLSPRFVAMFLITATIVGVWVSSYFQDKSGSEDPAQVVIDEVVGVGVAVLFHNFSLPVLISGFILFRFFDILKPWPIKNFERLPGGIGIMADDIVAGVMANILLTFLSHGLIYISGI